jgi:hypothetical protein
MHDAPLLHHKQHVELARDEHIVRDDDEADGVAPGELDEAREDVLPQLQLIDR